MNLFIMGIIDDRMVNHTVKKIVEAPPEDPTIVVYINSTGGEDNCDYAIYQALKLSGKQIITYAANNVFSAAVIIYLAGEYRYAHQYSRFMIHEVYHGENPDKKTAGNYVKGAAELRKLTGVYFKLIADNTKLTIPQIKKFVIKAPEQDWDFDTKTAKKFGLVTHLGLPVVPEIKDDDDLEFLMGDEEEIEEIEEIEFEDEEEVEIEVKAIASK